MKLPDVNIWLALALTTDKAFSQFSGLDLLVLNA